MPKLKRPKVNRKVKLICHDWSEYRAIGYFITVGKNSFKFFRLDEKDNLIPENECWKDCESWYYLDEDKNEN